MLLTIRQLARELRCSVPTVRRWVWFLRIRPDRQYWRTYRTKRGTRVGLTSLYASGALARIRRARRRS